MLLEVARELARGGQRDPELLGELADGALALRSDLDEQRHVPPPDRRVAVKEALELCGRVTAAPQAAHDEPQQPAQLPNLRIRARHRLPSLNSYHSITVMVRQQL